MNENLNDEQMDERLREYFANPWPLSESMFNSLLNDPPEVLAESIDELTDDAFCYSIPPEYAELWAKVLKTRSDRNHKIVRRVIEHLEWYLDPRNDPYA